ncbi:DUF2089 family protein [[Clostridium] polysaccharolyticum]|uniref:DUF2089 domain-containing protein n=1 Tax=[Clostridium] polysaccharolyticum TaxID=29364 RepID=A0A1I0BR09_9FIRM|nr:DUF2089 family protein [[Clostridium] polysaccharolyticum]SET08722.1 Protein of unknown function [[Clostridium] polysaccharolyticum]
MSIRVLPGWMVNLESEDINFIKNFLLASGSLKEIAKQYNVTYPTVRNRLDKLIKKIELNNTLEDDSYITLIKNMALNERIDFDTAKILISEYRNIQKEGN